MTEAHSPDETDEGPSKGETPFTGPVIRSNDRHVPQSLHDEQLWVLWNMNEKKVRAPWKNGHCYPADWGSDVDEDEDRPELTYPEVREYTDLGVEELHRRYPFPNGPNEGLPDEIRPTIVVPHSGTGNKYTERLGYVDLDDVRDPETERVTPEAGRIIEELDSYTEISSSGTGVHILFLGEVPYDGWVNGDPLNGTGSIEIYDHSRILAGTWDHVEGTPTVINERQDVINRLLAEYSVHRLRKAWNDIKRERYGLDGGEELLDAPVPEGSSTGGTAPEGDRSPYFDVPIEHFATPAITVRSNGSEQQGPHPEHGKTTGGAESDSTNYNLDTALNCWHCFAHTSGGGAMEMAAVLAEAMNCEDTGEGSLGRLTNREFLRVCLYARDTLDGFTEEMDPPYRALVAVAKEHDFPMADENREILGATSAKLARVIYDELTLAELDG